MDVKTTLTQFDEFLTSKDLSFEAIIIGGAALNVMGVIARQTTDIDCIDPQIPALILQAATDFRRLNPNLRLIEKWINNGHDGLVQDLPAGWRLRLSIIYTGRAVTLHTLGRLDLLKTKLFAFCDRDTDLPDCVAMRPTLQELDDCLPWVSERDANPLWPANVTFHFGELKKELGHEE